MLGYGLMPQTSPMNWMMISLLPMMALKLIMSSTLMNKNTFAKVSKNSKFLMKWMW